jgi:hypothetical protein
VRWTIEQVNGQRILTVRQTSPEPWPDDELVAAGMEPPSRDSDQREESLDSADGTGREAEAEARLRERGT